MEVPCSFACTHHSIRSCVSAASTVSMAITTSSFYRTGCRSTWAWSQTTISSSQRWSWSRASSWPWSPSVVTSTTWRISRACSTKCCRLSPLLSPVSGSASNRMARATGCKSWSVCPSFARSSTRRSSSTSRPPMASTNGSPNKTWLWHWTPGRLRTSSRWTTQTAVRAAGPLLLKLKRVQGTRWTWSTRASCSTRTPRSSRSRTSSRNMISLVRVESSDLTLFLWNSRFFPARSITAHSSKESFNLDKQSLTTIGCYRIIEEATMCRL